MRSISVRSSLRSSTLLGAGIALSVVTGTAAQAQDSSAAPARSYGLEEIVVTAQKREESLQKTPLAISAVSSEMIEQRNLSGAADLGAIAPNLTTTQGPNSASHLIVHIRGIGESEPVLTADAPVGMYVDGVVIGRSTASIFDVVDLERVEVLRGPQGTLQGRNTTGGAVNLITRKPADELGVTMTGGYGNYNALQGRISLDTGYFGDTGLKAKLTYLHKQRDGYVNDLNHKKSRDPGAYNTEAFRVALAYEDGGPFRANYSFDINVTNSTAPASQLTVMTDQRFDYFSRSPEYGGAPLVGPSLTRLSEIRSEGTFVFDKNEAHGLTLEYDLGPETTLRSITGYRKWKNTTKNTDIDGNAGLIGPVFSFATGQTTLQPVSLFGADKWAGQNQWTQEINLLGSIGDRFDYVVGGFYFRERAHERNPQYYTVPLGNGNWINATADLAYRTKNESKALFGQFTYDLADALSFTGGVRYTKDKKSLIQTIGNVRDLSRSWDKLNYSATLQYEPTDDIMVYARFATGYKAGGFNARAINNDGYDPEQVKNYELGIKSQLFDRRLRLNLTGFYMTLDDKQLNQFVAVPGGGAQTQTVNAGSANFKGVEVEFEAAPFENFTVNGSLGYTDRKFDKFVVNVEIPTDSPNYDPDGPPVQYEPTDVADEARFSYAAGTTWNLGAQYTIPEVAGGNLSFRLDYSYRSKIYFNVLPRFAVFDNTIASPGVGLLDGRITLGDLAVGGGTAQIGLWGKNLTDKTYRVSGIDFGALGFATNTYGLPRTYGVDVRFVF